MKGHRIAATAVLHTGARLHAAIPSNSYEWRAARRSASLLWGWRGGCLRHTVTGSSIQRAL